MYDQERIAKIISDIEKYYEEMNGLGIKKKTDLEDRKNYHALSMVLFTIINRIIDLGSEIVLANKLGMPSTYSETFDILSRKSIINEKLKTNLIMLVRYRNRLSHEYFDLDEDELFELYSQISVANEFVALARSLVTKK